MEQPQRLRILKAITGALEEIKHDPMAEFPEYFTEDMAGKVFRGRSKFGEGDPVPMISILEAPLPVERALEKSPHSADNAPWDLLIQGCVKNDRDNPTDPAHSLARDIQVRLNKEKRKLSGRTRDYPFGEKSITGISIGRPVVRPPDEVSANAHCWIGLSLSFVEDPLD